MANSLKHDFLSALLGEWVVAQERLREDMEIKAAVTARIAASHDTHAKLKPAFAIHGIAAGTKEGWDTLRAVLGERAYLEAIQRGKQNLADARSETTSKPDVATQLPSPPPPPDREREGEKEREGSEANDGDDSDATPIRELVLNELRVAFPDGLTAAAIRERVQAIRGPLHDKTIGMTLYRLSLLNMSRRDGRTWFFVPPKAETENPGGDTPGLFKSE